MQVASYNLKAIKARDKKAESHKGEVIYDSCR